MATVDEFLAWKSDRLQSHIRRPGMWAVGAWAIAVALLEMFEDLAFISGRSPDVSAAVHALNTRYDNLGPPGIATWFGDSGGSYTEEAASVYAEVGHQLGFVNVGVLLTAHEWASSGLDAKSTFAGSDLTMSDVEHRFPVPTLKVGNTVFCYASENRNMGWAFLDFHTWRRPGVEPMLRDARLPAARARDGLVFTPFGANI